MFNFLICSGYIKEIRPPLKEVKIVILTQKFQMAMNVRNLNAQRLSVVALCLHAVFRTYFNRNSIIFHFCYKWWLLVICPGLFVHLSYVGLCQGHMAYFLKQHTSNDCSLGRHANSCPSFNQNTSQVPLQPRHTFQLLGKEL